jgi:hypothetical protein
MHPQPRVRNNKAHEHSHHRFTELVPDFPAQWFTAYSVLSPVTGSFATVACASYRRLDSSDLAFRRMRDLPVVGRISDVAAYKKRRAVGAGGEYWAER